jgi:hypothetical protein
MVLITWRRTLNHRELSGYDFSENLLTASEPKRKRGRPQNISDENLQWTRNELLFVLEENWALIGWELQRAETPSNIRAALRCIDGSPRRLEPFCLEYHREATFSQLQAARKRFQNASGKLSEAQANLEQCQERSERAQSAQRAIGNAPKSDELRLFCREAESSLALATNAVLQLQADRTRIEETVRQRAAWFAQSELLEFIRSDRYRSTPLRFANAMAGLPAIRWRQSMDRCRGLKDGASHGVTYARFLIVEATLKHPAANAEEAIERLETRLLQASDHDVFACNALAENWYFLRRAIESVLKSKHQPDEAIPYRIFAEYQRRFRVRSALDILLAEREVITTPAYLKERQRISVRNFEQ